MMKSFIPLLLVVIVAATAAIVWRSGDSAQDATVTSDSPVPITPATAVPGTSVSPATLHVVKSPSCGCCGKWVDHVRDHVFTVTTQDVEDVSPFKQEAGITPRLASCHTAFVDGYVIEGHVPAADIQRLLAEKPDAIGLTVPGMPMGSPGMEIESGHVDAYEVLLIERDGSTRVFSRHGS